MISITIDEIANKYIDERWHIIDDFENYIITESGNVYAYRDNKTGWQGFRMLRLRGRNNPNRYLSICLCKNNKKKYVQIHRLVAKYFVDGYFHGAVVNHKDTNIHNNNYTNLEWITQKENIHKSYISSKINQVRNYCIWKILHPDGNMSEELKGIGDIKQYIEANKLNISITSLQKYKTSNGYKLLKQCKQII